MKAICTLANGGWVAANLPAWLRFQSALRQPELAQRRILAQLLAMNADSAYGRAHRFDKMRSPCEFRERVPIVEQEHLEPWIARLLGGEQGVLTRERVTRLVPTSGSTAGRKLIPFTATFQSELSAAVGPWIVDLARQYPTILSGPAYWSISPAIPLDINEASEVPIGFGDDSEYLGGCQQWLVQSTFAVPPVLRFVTDLDCSRYLTLLCLLRAPALRLISVWHPSFLTLLLDTLPSWWEELLDDLERGGCRRAGALAPEFRKAFTARPQQRRAAELRRVGCENPQAIWPHLRVVSCWRDGQAVLSAAALEKRLPHATIQGKGLLATEAFISLPYQGFHPIAIASHFYEFSDERGKIMLAHELRRAEAYSVIVTTGSGLWRYRLGDLVEVDGFVGSTPSLRFVGRSGNVSDVCGEKLSEAFVTRAIESACATLGFVPTFAMIAPENGANGACGYTLFVEGEAPAELTAIVEQELRKNPHYALCLDLRQLLPLQRYKVASGAYSVFCTASGSEARCLGSIKPQALSQSTDWRSRFAK